MSLADTVTSRIDRGDSVQEIAADLSVSPRQVRDAILLDGTPSSAPTRRPTGATVAPPSSPGDVERLLNVLTA